MSNVTIQEEYSLPSKGMIYNTPFDPNIKLRSMTVAEEMKRLTATESPYMNMSEIIEDCLLTKLPVSVYDLCLGDYQYLIHKLRVTTYGPEYPITAVCPYCGELFDSVVNLDALKINEYDESVKELATFELPISKRMMKIRFQTPRDLDRIDKRKKDMKKQFPDMKDDPSLMLNLVSIIDTIDGQPMNQATVEEMVKSMPMGDVNMILQRSQKMNEKVGVDIMLDLLCPNCEHNVRTPFRFTNEFFRPEVN